MCRCKYGNPKKRSSFICLKCLQINQLGDGIQRSQQREKFHIKDLTCMCVNLEEITKNLEVRYCDDFQEMMNKAMELRPKYYT